MILVDFFKNNNTEVVCVPTNLTCQIQSLGLTVNGYEKKFTSLNFNEWYSSQIMKQLGDGKELHDIDI